LTGNQVKVSRKDAMKRKGRKDELPTASIGALPVAPSQGFTYQIAFPDRDWL
jgi:hypothetical protein